MPRALWTYARLNPQRNAKLYSSSAAAGMVVFYLSIRGMGWTVFHLSYKREPFMSLTCRHDTTDGSSCYYMVKRRPTQRMDGRAMVMMTSDDQWTVLHELRLIVHSVSRMDNIIAQLSIHLSIYLSSCVPSTRLVFHTEITLYTSITRCDANLLQRLHFIIEPSIGLRQWQPNFNTLLATCSDY